MDFLPIFGSLKDSGPLGQGAGVALVVFFGIFMLRRHRSDDDKKREDRAARTMDDLQNDLDRAREQLKRMWSAAFWWFGRTHRERAARERDRISVRRIHPEYQWEDLPEIEPFAEEDERPD